MYELHAALAWVERLAAVGAAIASLEVMARPAALRVGGLWDWEVLRLRGGWAFGRAAGVVLGWPGIRWLHAVRLAAAVVLLAPADVPALRTVAIVVVAATTVLQNGRTMWGLDGADQLTAIIFVALAAGHLVGTDRALAYALTFIAAQVGLSYFIAGVAKAGSMHWRSKPVLAGIMSSSAYGHPRAAALLDAHPGLARWMGRAVFTAEILLPLALVAPPPYAWALLGVGLCFHVGTAVLMGLNTFFWAFVAAYPAVVYVNAQFWA